MPLLHHRLCRCFALLILGLAFLSYPLAAVPVKTFSFMHQLSLPSQWLLALAAVPVILSAAVWPRWRFAGPALVLLGSVALNAAIHREVNEATVILAGYALVPWAVAVIWAGPRPPGLRLVGLAVTIFWFTQIAAALLAVRAGREPVGFSGNRNWLAASILTTAPWAAVWGWHAFGAGGRRWRWLPVASVTLLTLAVLWQCHSRGVWLALAGVALLHVWWALRRLERALLVLFLILLPITAAALYGRQIVRVLQLDVRLPMIGRTVAMTVDHDLTAAAAATLATLNADHLRQLQSPLGVGPGRFREVFTPYRAASTYGERGTAASVTIHPHNEFLNVSAQVGLAAGLAWLGLLLILLRRPDWGSAEFEAARLGGLVLAIAGGFDMTLVQAPSSLLAPLFFGLCWSPHFVRREVPAADTPLAAVRDSLVFASLLAIGLTGIHGVTREWRLNLQRRQALFAEYTGRHREAVDKYRRIVATEPLDLESWYTAGRLALNELQQPDEALGYLRGVVEIDPNYAHVNGLIGSALMMAVKPREAISFYQRECQLYPQSAEVWQQYFNGLTFAGECQLLPRVAARIDETYRRRALVVHGEAGLRESMAKWLAAVERNDRDEATTQAAQLCRPFHLGFVDPAFHLATPDEKWPTALLGDGFNLADFAYWRQLVFARDLLAAAPAEPASRLQWLVDRFHGRLELKADAEPAFVFPEELWRQGRGHPLAAWYAFAFVARHAGFWVELEVDQQGYPVGGVAVAPAAAWRVDLAAGTVVAEPAAAGRQGTWEGVFLFQEMLLKNRLLGVLARQYLPDMRLEFDQMPTVTLVYTLALEGATRCPSLDEMSRHLAKGQLRQIRQRLLAFDKSLAAPVTDSPPK